MARTTHPAASAGPTGRAGRTAPIAPAVSAGPASRAASAGPHAPSRAHAAATWACRAAFALVFAVNVHCALSFVIDPASYAGAYELAGVPGAAATRGMGVAFLMWNCTYPLVIWQPARFHALAGVVLAQQVVGLAGETAILAGLPAGHDVLAGAIARFIAFDGLGLVLMVTAFAALLLADRRRARTDSIPRKC